MKVSEEKENRYIWGVSWINTATSSSAAIVFSPLSLCVVNTYNCDN